jgi:hypothetical protein
MPLTQVPPALLTSTTGTGSTVVLSASPTFTGTVTTPGVTFSDASSQTAAASPFVLKNRIINGDMRIDQRNAGASVAIGNAYSADRWRVENSTSGTATVQQVSDAPTGFSSSIKYTVTSVDSSLSSTDCAFIQQTIEGFNFSDMLYGTANAKTVTLSFWVKSSVTGTFGATLANNAYNRGYPASFTVNTANTWEQKTATITGDTTGTWIGDTNGIGVRVSFGMAAGSDRASASGAWAAAVVLGVNSQVNLMATNGATFQVTGVQLEQNTSATPFERRLYNQELANCQRYYEKSYPISVVPGANTGNGSAFSTQNVGVITASYILTWVNYKVQKRTDATVSVWDTVGNSGKCTRFTLGAATSTNQNITIDLQGESAMEVYSGSGDNRAGIALQWTASAEL